MALSAACKVCLNFFAYDGVIFIIIHISRFSIDDFNYIIRLEDVAIRSLRILINLFLKESFSSVC